MNERRAPVVGYTPDRWFVCFTERAAGSWITRHLPIGRFRHVSAIGYVAALGVWIFYDVSLGRTTIALDADSPEMESMKVATRDMEILSIPALISPARVPRFGFWCVPAIAHLVGIRACALRPDTLHRLLLASGAYVVQRAPRGENAERDHPERPVEGGAPAQ